MRAPRPAAATALLALAFVLLASACSDSSSGSSDAAGLDGDPARDSTVDVGDGSRDVADAPDAARDATPPDTTSPDTTPADTIAPDAFSNPNFTTIVVDAQGNAGRDVSIALDSNGVAQLAYQTASRGLRFAELSGATFAVTTLDNTSLAGEFSDIAVGGGVIAIAARAAGKPTYWTKATPWTSAPADSSGGAHIALFIDSGGKAHMCHNGSRGEVLYYTYQDGSGFKTEKIAGTLLSGQKVGADCDIVVDSSGGVHVSFDNANWLNLGYAHKDSGSSWGIDIAASDSLGKVGSYTSIVLDSLGAPMISYFRSVDNTVALATKQGAVWGREIIDNVGAIAAYTSLAIDGAGALHASYYNSTSGLLRYAKRATSAGTWQKQTVAVVGTGSGGYNDIAVDAQNKAHIAYYNTTLKRLEYAKQK